MGASRHFIHVRTVDYSPYEITLNTSPRCQQHGIEPLDMVVVNLYPFESTVGPEKVSVSKKPSNRSI